MMIHILRHGDAEGTTPDRERRLSARGRDEAEQIGHWMSRQRIRLSEIAHSDLRRAVETAEIVASIVGRPPLRAREELRPGAAAAIMAEELVHLRDDVLVVSHLPLVSLLVSSIVTGDEGLSLVSFTTATLVSLGNDGSGWVVCSVVSPDDLD